MSDVMTKVFLGNESCQEKHLVAASASVDFIEVFYALENRCARNGTSCTVSSHVWYGAPRMYVIEEISTASRGQ